MTIKSYNYISDITQEVFSLYNYPKYVIDAFRVHDYVFIRRVCNINIFKKMRDSNYQTKYTDTNWGISYYIHYPIINLQKIIKLILNHYKTILYDKSNKMRTVIIGVIVDYFFVMGKSKMFIDNIIKCGLWGVMSLIHKISPIDSSKDMTITDISNNDIKQLIKLNITCTSTLRTLFIFNDCQTIVEHIHKYDTQTILNNIQYIKNTDTYDYLIKNKIIPLNTSFITLYHKNCQLKLLIYLIKMKHIIPRKKHIEHIFKHHDIGDRYEMNWYDFFNNKAKGNNFRKYIIEYLDIIETHNVYVNVIYNLV